MPETRPRSSTEANGPLDSRSAMIFCAVLGPTPGSVSRAAASAELRSIGALRGARGRAGRPRPGGDARHRSGDGRRLVVLVGHGNLLAVAHRTSEVDELDLSRRAASPRPHRSRRPLAPWPAARRARDGAPSRRHARTASTLQASVAGFACGSFGLHCVRFRSDDLDRCRLRARPPAPERHSRYHRNQYGKRDEGCRSRRPQPRPREQLAHLLLHRPTPFARRMRATEGTSRQVPTARTAFTRPAFDTMAPSPYRSLARS